MSGPFTWLAGSAPPNMDPASIRRIRFGKSPSDKTVVDCDFSGALSAIDCDTISTSSTPAATVIRNDGGPADCYVLGTPSVDSSWTKVSVWLGGGSAGYEYLISVTVQSADGQIITRSFIMPCTLR